MFKGLKKLFSASDPLAGEVAMDSQERLKVATCVFLLEIARADDEFCEEERTRIVESLCKQFSLSPEDAQELIDLATEKRSESHDLWSFSSEINQACSHEEKLEIIEEVWRVVFSDGSMDGHERYLAHQMAKLMNLRDDQLIEAKVKVLNELRG